MRAFVVLSLLASAIAMPQGYSYQQQQQFRPNIGFPNKFGGSAAQANAIAQEGQTFLQEALQNTKLMQTLLNGPSSSFVPAPTQQSYYQRPQPHQQQQVPFLQQQYQGSGSNNLGYQTQQHPPQYQQPNYNHAAPVVTKDIYVHVAPEEPEERYTAPPVPVAPPRKHYRIVFIKAPTPSISSTALRIKQAPSEEKTIIYVLTKKPDPLDLQAAIQEAAPKPPSKPEVYFIKYKTQEEAQHAQRTIQAQYDQLGGTTQVSDEGIAPVTSVIGALDQQHGSLGITTGSGASVINHGGSGKYLPPIVI